MRVFVTGASGWIGSAVVPELIAAGHQVVGLARSDASASAVQQAGAEVRRGSLDDLDVLRDAAEASDGVIHLAFKHDVAFAEGRFEDAADADRRAVEVFGDVLAGTDRPFVLASGLVGLMPGRVVTERDGLVHDPSLEIPAGPATRLATAQLVLSYASRGIRSSIVRLPPTVHGDGDQGFIASIVGVAREEGVSGSIGDGANRWPAGHVLDAAHLFRLALEKAPAGSALHGSAEEGVPIRAVAEVIGRHLGQEAVSVAPKDAAGHFGWLAPFIGTDSPASSALTRELVGWRPTQPGLIDDLEKGHYFA
jgi:nucleoside-diphosphate-sugar epimerase